MRGESVRAGSHDADVCKGTMNGFSGGMADLRQACR
jgi:hypothetical protein